MCVCVLNMLGGGGVLLSHERRKIWCGRRRRYFIFYLSYDHVTWYTYRLCCLN